MGTFHYFAYGSNMLTARLRALTMSVGGAARDRNAGRARAGVSEGIRRWLRQVRHPGWEAGGCRSRRRLSDCVRVSGNSSTKPRGSARDTTSLKWKIATSQGTIPCVTYVATRINDGLRPYDWYRNLVLAGALEHGLPDAYVDQIARDSGDAGSAAGPRARARRHCGRSTNSQDNFLTSRHD